VGICVCARDALPRLWARTKSALSVALLLLLSCASSHREEQEQEQEQEEKEQEQEILRLRYFRFGSLFGHVTGSKKEDQGQ